MEFADQGDLEKQVQIQAEKGYFFSETQVTLKVIYYQKGVLQIWNWFAQICLALKYLHDRHIIHRDIKLSNIFLTKDGLIKLGDFGVAKQLQNTQELANTTLGTPFYVSPEICKGEPYSYKSDIWMLGCVLFELCSLDKPFKATSLHALVRKIVDEEPPLLDERYFSLRCRCLVGQLMAKEPEQRPSLIEILKIPEVLNQITLLKQNVPIYQKPKANTCKNTDLKGKSFADYLQQVQSKESKKEESTSNSTQITTYVERFFDSPTTTTTTTYPQQTQICFLQPTKLTSFQSEQNYKLKSQIANRNQFESQRKSNYSISYTREKILSSSSDVHLPLHNNLDKKLSQSNQKQTGQKILSFHDILNKVEHNPEVFIDDQHISDFLFNQQLL